MVTQAIAAIFIHLVKDPIQQQRCRFLLGQQFLQQHFDLINDFRLRLFIQRRIFEDCAIQNENALGVIQDTGVLDFVQFQDERAQGSLIWLTTAARSPYTTVHTSTVVTAPHQDGMVRPCTVSTCDRDGLGRPSLVQERE